MDSDIQAYIKGCLQGQLEKYCMGVCGHIKDKDVKMQPAGIDLAGLAFMKINVKIVYIHKLTMVKLFSYVVSIVLSLSFKCNPLGSLPHL